MCSFTKFQLYYIIIRLSVILIYIASCRKKMYVDNVHLKLFHRHPDPKHRPAFVLISKYLDKSEDDLLNISDEVIQSNGEDAVTLGNTLSHGFKLYSELQTVYKQH